MQNSQNFSKDPVYQAILQTHADSLKQYLTLGPSLRTLSQTHKPPVTHYQNSSQHTSPFKQNQSI